MKPSFIRWVLIIAMIPYNTLFAHSTFWTSDSISSKVAMVGISSGILPASLPVIGNDAPMLFAWIIGFIIIIILFSSPAFKYMPLEKTPEWIQVLVVVGALIALRQLTNPEIVSSGLLTAIFAYVVCHAEELSSSQGSSSNYEFNSEDPEENKNTYSTKVTSRTEEDRGPLDLMVSCISGDDEHGYKTTISQEGRPDIVGFGNTPEEAEERARREYQFHKER